MTEEELKALEEKLNKQQEAFDAKEAELNKNDGTTDIDAQVQEAIKGIKEKLDAAYSKRDEALTKVEEFEKDKREKELKRLEEEGKHKEVYELKLKELEEENKKLGSENVGLARDNIVKDALAKYSFRSAKAMSLTQSEISQSLVKDKDNRWVSADGRSITEYIKDFAENEDNEFLFKAKENKGGGGGKLDPSKSTPKSVYDIPQKDLIAKIKSGELKRERG